MVTVHERTTSLVVLQRLPRLRMAPSPTEPDGAAARATARRYREYVCAVWRGDRDAKVFGEWLMGFWRGECPFVGAREPDAVSPHGGGGRGIQWHETRGAVGGHVPGVGGGYRVPIDASPPGGR
jgi:hypothetical protein